MKEKEKSDRFYQHLAKWVGAKVVGSCYLPKFAEIESKFRAHGDFLGGGKLKPTSGLAFVPSGRAQGFWDEALKVAYDSEDFEEDESSWLFTGNRILISDVRSNPNCDLEQKINSIKGPISPWLISKIKAIRAASDWNRTHSAEIFATLHDIDWQFSGFDFSYRQPGYPRHYQNSFELWTNNDLEIAPMKATLTAFFRDYTEPSHGLSFFKQLSRHYIPEANELINGIGEGASKEELQATLRTARKQLMIRMIDEGRQFGDSHLLRRIDFALYQLEQHQEPTKRESPGYGSDS